MTITKDLKIVHMTNFAPGKSGMWESVQELMYEERRVGYDARIIDVVSYNPLRLKLDKKNNVLKEGLVQGIENDTWSQEADILCWHRFLPEVYFSDNRKNLIMFLHGMPDYVFMQEHEGKDKAFSLIKGSYNALDNCRAFIGMWRSHDGYWSHLLKNKLVNTNCWVNFDKINKKADGNFDKNHIKLVCLDTWRGHKEPYWILNAVKILIEKYERKEIPFKITLDIFGQEPREIPSCWFAVIDEWLNKYIFLRGYGKPQEIFDNHDIVLTQTVEETRVVRESLLAGMPIIGGEVSADYTDYKAGFRDVKKYSEEIERCCYDIIDEKKRKDLHIKNREYALNNFDIKKNAEPIFECFERIVKENRLRTYTPKYWDIKNIKVNNPDINKLEHKGFKTKTLTCSVKYGESAFWQDSDNYFINFKDIVEYDKDNDCIVKYNFNFSYPEKYFDYIYIDYLQILPEYEKKMLEDKLSKLLKTEGKLLDCFIKDN
jgi:hypothetical protein